jgi:hypothetical protein
MIFPVHQGMHGATSRAPRAGWLCEMKLDHTKIDRGGRRPLREPWSSAILVFVIKIF